MYQFNTALWHDLPDILHVKRTVFYEMIGTSSTPFWNVIEHKNIRLTYLCNICNRFRISMRSFITEADTLDIPEKVVIPESEWIPITLHIENLHNCYKQSVNGCTRANFFKVINYTPSQYTKRVRRSSTPSLMLADMLRVCNTFGFSPWRVIKDDNHNITLHDLLVHTNSLEQRVTALEQAIYKMAKSKPRKKPLEYIPQVAEPNALQDD